MKQIKAKAKKVKLFIMDVDGTLTDGKIYIGPQGEVFKRLIPGWLGIKRLREKDYPVIITGEVPRLWWPEQKNWASTKSTRELRINLRFTGIWWISIKLMMRSGFIGDDLNDLPLLNKVGLSLECRCGGDGAAAVDYVTKQKGGEGAVREAIDLILG